MTLVHGPCKIRSIRITLGIGAFRTREHVQHETPEAPGHVRQERRGAREHVGNAAHKAWRHVGHETHEGQKCKRDDTREHMRQMAFEVRQEGT